MTGLSVFDAVGVALGHGPLQQQKQPILTNETLRSSDLFLSLSPRLAYSEREAQIIKEFLVAGGTLVVSFHDQTSSQNVGELLAEFELPLPVRADPAFVDRQPIEVFADRAVGPISPEMRVSFYSRYLLDLPECRDRGVACYAARWPVGRGQVIVFAGYPPFVNGLITLGDNPELSARLRTRGDAVVIDDYRQFFSEKTVTDLLMEPSFAVPVAGVLIAAIVFLFFGDFNLIDRAEPESDTESHGSLHLFQEQMLKGLLRSVDRGSRVEQQLHHVERLFPEQKEAIEKVRRSLASGGPLSAGEVCALHREFLRLRGLNTTQMPSVRSQLSWVQRTSR
jgi:hypothetical protein